MSYSNNSTSLLQKKQDTANISYFLKTFLIGFFPRKKTDETKISMNYGSFTLKMSSSVGLPYGSYSRLLLHYICNKSFRSSDGIIDMGNSFSSFLRFLDLQSTGIVVHSVLEQLYRLYEFSFSIEKNFETAGDVGGFCACRFNIIHGVNLSWHTSYKNRLKFFPCDIKNTIKLSTDFFKTINTDKQVYPVSWDVLRKIKQSPFALDVYCWWTYTAYISQFWNEDKSISWDSLIFQFCNKKSYTYLEKKEFKKSLKRAILKVQSALSCPSKMENMVFNTDHLFFKKTDPDVAPQVKLF